MLSGRYEEQYSERALRHKAYALHGGLSLLEYWLERPLLATHLFDPATGRLWHFGQVTSHGFHFEHGSSGQRGRDTGSLGHVCK